MAIHKYDPNAVEVTAVEREDSDAQTWSNRMYINKDENQFHGIWQADPGVHANLPGQETVVILRGRATVSNEKGESIEVGPGDLVFVDEGEVATWTVHEQLRKVFVINS